MSNHHVFFLKPFKAWNDPSPAGNPPRNPRGPASPKPHSGVDAEKLETCKYAKNKNGKTSSFFCGLLYYLVVDYWLLINYQYGLPMGAIKWYVSGDNIYIYVCICIYIYICLFISYVKQQDFTDRKQGHFGIHSPIQQSFQRRRGEVAIKFAQAILKMFPKKTKICGCFQW
jgi:hypothetical protein